MLLYNITHYWVMDEGLGKGNAGMVVTGESQNPQNPT